MKWAGKGLPNRKGPGLFTPVRSRRQLYYDLTDGLQSVASKAVMDQTKCGSTRQQV